MHARLHRSGGDRELLCDLVDAATAVVSGHDHGAMLGAEVGERVLDEDRVEPGRLRADEVRVSLTDGGPYLGRGRVPQDIGDAIAARGQVLDGLLGRTEGGRV